MMTDVLTLVPLRYTCNTHTERGGEEPLECNKCDVLYIIYLVSFFFSIGMATQIQLDVSMLAIGTIYTMSSVRINSTNTHRLSSDVVAN